MKSKRVIGIFFIILVLYVLSYVVLINCPQFTDFLDNILKYKYVKVYAKLTIPIVVPVITVVSTWVIHKKSEEKYINESIERQNEKQEEKNAEVRPFFLIKENEKEHSILFAIASLKEVAITDVKMFYINSHYKIKKCIYMGAITSAEFNNLGISGIDQKLYWSSLYIVIFAKTMRNESVYYIYRRDDSSQYNLIRKEENRYQNIDGKYIEDNNIMELLRYIDIYNSNSNIWNIKYKTDFEKETVAFLRKMGEYNNINELNRAISLVRYYSYMFNDEEIARILNEIKRAVELSEENILEEGTSNVYFVNNMIGNNEFSHKYKQLFIKADEEQRVIYTSEMMEYITEYMNEYTDNLNPKGSLEKDCALRNIEVYLRNDINGNIDETTSDKIIEIFTNIMKKEIIK